MNKEKGFTKRVSNAIFQAKAQKEVDNNVRFQVWVHKKSTRGIHVPGFSIHLSKS